MYSEVKIGDLIEVTVDHLGGCMGVKSLVGKRGTVIRKFDDQKVVEFRPRGRKYNSKGICLYQSDSFKVIRNKQLTGW